MRITGPARSSHLPQGQVCPSTLGPAMALVLLPRLSRSVTLKMAPLAPAPATLSMASMSPRGAPIACSSAGRRDPEGRQCSPLGARRGCGGSHSQNFKVLWYHSRSPTVTEIRFSDCRDPLARLVDHLVGPNFAVAAATGEQGTFSTMMAILPFACDCVWGPVNTTRRAGRAGISV